MTRVGFEPSIFQLQILRLSQLRHLDIKESGLFANFRAPCVLNKFRCYFVVLLLAVINYKSVRELLNHPVYIFSFKGWFKKENFAIFSKNLKFLNFHQNNSYRRFFYARNRLRALLNLENAFLTLIQGRNWCIKAKIG
jgi:hypothetical protein